MTRDPLATAARELLAHYDGWSDLYSGNARLLVEDLRVALAENDTIRRDLRASTSGERYEHSFSEDCGTLSCVHCGAPEWAKSECPVLLRSALEAHHETHRSREFVEPRDKDGRPAYSLDGLLYTVRTGNDEDADAAWAEVTRRFRDAAPAPHHASQHEADAALGKYVMADIYVDGIYCNNCGARHEHWDTPEHPSGAGLAAAPARRLSSDK